MTMEREYVLGTGGVVTPSVSWTFHVLDGALHVSGRLNVCTNASVPFRLDAMEARVRRALEAFEKAFKEVER